MTDQITISGIRAVGYHGVLRAERESGQEFVVDLVVDVDFAAAARSDDLEDTVDYSVLATQVHSIITGDPVDLIETLAERIATRCLEHRAVRAVAVEVHKPHAPIAVPFADVTVRIRRARDA